MKINSNHNINMMSDVGSIKCSQFLFQLIHFYGVFLMRCETHIVECLRKDGVYPEVIDTLYSSSWYPSYGIDYENTNIDHFFHSQKDPNDTWTLDLKRVVSITGYQFKANVGENWIKNWDIYIKKDNKWVLIDPHQNNTPPGSTIYNLKNLESTRYLKIKGGTTEAGNKFLAFYYIKLFGYTTRADACKCTGKSYSRISNMVYICIALIVSS